MKDLNLPNSHCHFCGSSHTEKTWPRTCPNCLQLTFKNPIPVAVAVVPIRGPQDRYGLLTIKRSIPPKVGHLALPGGYINLGESWQQAASRELFEETGLNIDSKNFTTYEVLSAVEAKVVLIFGYANVELTVEQLPKFSITNETSERLVLYEPQELAFPLHTEVMLRFFQTINSEKKVLNERI